MASALGARGRESAVQSLSALDTKNERRPWRALKPHLEAAGVVAVQYNPFSFGRRGVAPWLPILLTALRRRRGRPLIVMTVHETWVPALNLRWFVLGALQRAQ